jgi:amidohydrolase
MIEFPKVGIPSTSVSGEPAPAKASALRCDAVPTQVDAFDHPHLGKEPCNCTGTGFNIAAHELPEAPLAAAAIAGRDAAVSVGELKKLIEPRLPALFETYKDIHQNPELSGEEVRTRGIVAKRMKELGYEVTENFGKYPDGRTLESVIAVCKNGEGPMLLVRADMDALPIIEKTGAPYASTKKVTRPDGSQVGVMHACGHDVHTTNLLGFADIMMQLKDRWSGTLMLVAQPAEEAIGGAKGLVSNGLYEKFGTPDAAIALHTFGPATPGVIATRAGAMMAAVDTVKVTLHGRGAHGSTPQASIDPIVMLGNLINESHHIVSRNVTPGTPALITIGRVEAGTAANIIPKDAVAHYTIRSFADDVQKVLMSGVSRVALGVAAMAGAPQAPDVEKVQDTYPAVINTADLVKRLTGVWQKELAGEGIKVVEMPQIMAGEDFPHYGKPDRSVPTTFFFVGCTPQAELDRRQQAGLPPPVSHTEDFLPDAVATMRTGLLAFTTVATDFLQKKA